MKLKHILAVASFIVAVILATVAMIIPPQGIIDSSVLWFTSQCLVFAATLLGFSMKADNLNEFVGKNYNNYYEMKRRLEGIEPEPQYQNDYQEGEQEEYRENKEY